MTGAVQPAIARFAQRFGGPPDVVVRAPGRVNIIGDHTDYNDGWVLPAAIGAHTLVLARRRHDSQVRAVAFDLDNETATFDATGPFADGRRGDWTDYVRGIAAVMAAQGMAWGGADIAILGTIPIGAGLSSSASLTVGVGLAAAGLHHADNLPGPITLARMAQAAECDFVGTQCGIMDQLAVACGTPAHALLIDCRLQAISPVPIPRRTSLLIIHSGVERRLVEGAYNARRTECEAAAQHLGVRHLRDIDLPSLEARRDVLDAVHYRRARHVVSENARVVAAAQALIMDDMITLGRLMAASHASLRDDFEVSHPDVDRLVGIVARSMGNAGGVRMTGAGFGGAIVAVLPDAAVAAVVDAVSKNYRTPAGQPALVLQEQAATGASFIHE